MVSGDENFRRFACVSNIVACHQLPVRCIGVLISENDDMRNDVIRPVFKVYEVCREPPAGYFAVYFIFIAEL